MSERTSGPPKQLLKEGTTTYENARVIITPEGPRHYRVVVSKHDDEHVRHAVERVIVNTAEVSLESPIWFVDVKVDVGVPLDEPGDTVWVWA